MPKGTSLYLHTALADVHFLVRGMLLKHFYSFSQHHMPASSKVVVCMQAKGSLPAGSIVSALLIEDLAKMLIPEIPAETPGLSSS